MYFDSIAEAFTGLLAKGTLEGVKFAGKAAYNLASQPVVTDNAEPMPPVAQELINNSGFVFSEGITKPETEDGHIMVVGGVGSGKSSCIAIPSLLSWRESVFAIDIKGELYEKTANMRTNVKLFNPMDSDTLGYDVFYLLKTATDQAQEAKAISHALIPLPPDIKEPFWIQSAQNLFAGAILHYFNEGYSFIETIDIILSLNSDELVKAIHKSETRIAAYFVNNFVDMKLEQLSSILAEISNHIMVFVTDKSIKNALSKEENICPEDLEYGEDIYVRIPENLLEQWKGLLTLMVSQFLTHFEKRQDRSSRPILFLLDEFARLGKIERIVSGLATLRSKNITICIILQSLAQLDLIYGKSARQIIADTCQYKAVLNINDVESQEYFSKAVGTYEKIKIINNQQYERITNFKAGSSISVSTEETAKIKPAEFATLKEIVLLTPYGAFKVARKAYYYQKEYIDEFILTESEINRLTKNDIENMFIKKNIAMIRFLHKNKTVKHLQPEAFKALLEGAEKLCRSKAKNEEISNSRKEIYEWLCWKQKELFPDL